jgi:glucokinase
MIGPPAQTPRWPGAAFDGTATSELIASGYMATQRRPTIIDIAKKAEVSFKTVSRVLNEHPRVAPELRARVLQAMAELDYQPSLAAAAVDRFCTSFGSLCGDYALAHGASAVVLAGSLCLRLRELLPSSGFGERFRFKGRYAQMMAGIPVKLITHPQPGLYGAAAAFASEHLK